MSESPNNTRDDDPEAGLAKWLILTAAIVVVVWLVAGFLPSKWLYPKQLSESGQFADSFGFVNSLFSGLAFGGVIVAILLQTRELKLQRKELEETQSALQQSAQAQTAMQSTMQVTAYLSALTSMTDTLASYQPDRYAHFKSIELRQHRLAIHMDWLLSKLQRGEQLHSFLFDDRQEMKHALNMLGVQWTDWLAANAQINAGDLERALANLAMRIEDTLSVFPESYETMNMRSVGQNIHTEIVRDFSTIPTGRPVEAVRTRAEMIARRLVGAGN